MVRTSRPGSAGFTLVEVLMAMLIMTVGLLGMLQAVNVAYQHNSRNKLREEALLVGEEQINDFRSRKYDAITTTVTRVVTRGNRNFSVTREATENASKSSKKIKVAIGYSFHNVSTAQVLYTMRSQ
jgi:type IV pilus assembly protein PilV